jgi:D-alanine-D-alanine ligase
MKLSLTYALTPNDDPNPQPALATLCDALRDMGHEVTEVLPSPDAAPLPTGPTRVGLIYNLKRKKPQLDGSDDDEAEFDSLETIHAIRDAIAALGHDVALIEARRDMPTRVQAERVQVAFNIAEGAGGRSRESVVPALLELLDIPYTGSDATTLAIALDKGLAKRIVRQAGVHTAPWALMISGDEPLPDGFTFPVVVKPVAEGSSKGITKTSVIHTEPALRALVRSLATRYQQGMLVEAFLSGREFTVGILGEGDSARALPPMEVVFCDPHDPNPIYAFEHKQQYSSEIRYDAPAQVDDALGQAIERAALDAYAALGCRDVARIDLRLDAQGRINFIECNPLPGLTPDWSDLCMIAKSAGLSYQDLIGQILAPALQRLAQKQAHAHSQQG